MKTRLRAYERISALNAQVTPKAPAPTNAAPGNTARAVAEPVGRSNQKVWAYTVLGVGGAALITSGALALATKNKNDEFEGSTDVMERRTLADSGKSFAMGSDIALGIGLTAAAIGSWLWLTAPDEQTALAPMLTHGGSGLVFVGAF